MVAVFWWNDDNGPIFTRSYTSEAEAHDVVQALRLTGAQARLA
jgi:hypothetical protein